MCESLLSNVVATMSFKQVSVLKEIRAGEQRVIMLPSGDRKFVQTGYSILVESGAGERAGYNDESYVEAGAIIVDAESAWNDSDIVLKYKAPDKSEFKYFREGLHLACFMHAEGNLVLAREMLVSNMTAYALEFCQTKRQEFPVPVSDSEISGKLSIILTAYHLQSHMGGSGKLLSKVPGCPPPKVVVIGYGNAGGAAAHLAAAMGADVTVFGTRWEGLRKFQASAPKNVKCLLNSPDSFEEEILSADVVVGAILISTHDTWPLLDESLVKRMRSGSVIVDITCGYGAGYMPTFDRFTTHLHPFYERFGVLHCKIDAMPASVPFTAVHATDYNVTCWLIEIANSIMSGNPSHIASTGLLVAKGEVIHSELHRHFDLCASG